MSAITLSRQLGSLGCDIGDLVAKRLGFQVVWRDLINEAARRAGAPEVALATIDELDLLRLRPSADARQAYHAAVRQVMEELANAGGVILIGRAGQAILRGRPDVLHVRLIAPVALRAERLAERKGISLEAAQEQIQASDANRKRYVRQSYGVNWEDPDLYDLVLNTARLSLPAAAEIICRAAENFPPSPQPPMKAEPGLACE